MEITGTIKKIGETIQVTDSFKKRELVVTTEEQYPQHIQTEFVQDKTEILNNYQEGEKVSVGINLKGREWTSPQGEVKYFNSIHGWKIEKLDNSTPPAQQSNDEDDMPF